MPGGSWKQSPGTGPAQSGVPKTMEELHALAGE